MKAFVIDGPGQWSLPEVDPPEAALGEVVVAVHRVGVCGTDSEFFRGTQPYLAAGSVRYPMRIGHEWCGRVVRVGQDVDAAWIGRRVTSDTMLGCHACAMCRRGRQHLCRHRTEIGVLGGRPGAMAEQIAVPVSAVHELPAALNDAQGALVEPASLALRAMRILRVPPGERVLVWGAGAIGLATVAFGAAMGSEMTLAARSERSFKLARDFGAHACVLESDVDDIWGSFEAAVCATPDAATPGRATAMLRPGGQMVLVGISGEPSPVEARGVVTGDLSVTGLLSGSPVFADTIEVMASGVGYLLERLVGAVIPLERVAESLTGAVRTDPSRGPKVQVAIGS